MRLQHFSWFVLKWFGEILLGRCMNCKMWLFIDWFTGSAWPLFSWLRWCDSCDTCDSCRSLIIEFLLGQACQQPFWCGKFLHNWLPSAITIILLFQQQISERSNSERPALFWLKLLAYFLFACCKLTPRGWRNPHTPSHHRGAACLATKQTDKKVYFIFLLKTIQKKRQIDRIHNVQITTNNVPIMRNHHSSSHHRGAARLATNKKFKN